MCMSHAKDPNAAFDGSSVSGGRGAAAAISGQGQVRSILILLRIAVGGWCAG